MNPRDLLSRSEQRALDLLERSLLGRGYRVYVQIPLRKVIEQDPAERLPRHEWNMLRWGELDFVVVNRDEGFQIEFAVEFDGHPSHRTAEGERRDCVKELLCFRAGIPLVRVPDEAIGEREQITLLEWIVDNFRVFRTDRERIDEAVELLNDYAESMERAPLADRAIALHTIKPFPATTAVQSRLIERYGICTPPRGLPRTLEDGWDTDNDPTFRWIRAPLKVVDLNFVPEEQDEHDGGSPRIKPNTYTLGLLRMAEGEWLHIAEVPIRWSSEHILAQALAAGRVGTWMWAVNVAMAEYRALTDIERWAERNLARLDHVSS